MYIEYEQSTQSNVKCTYSIHSTHISARTLYRVHTPCVARLWR